MTLTHRLLGAVLACSASSACGGGSDASALSATAGTSPGPTYLGQPTPGLVPERFAPGVVSTDAIELNGVFTPDGREFFYARLVDGVDTIFHSRHPEGAFAVPANIGGPVNTAFGEGDTFVAPDESYLIVASTRPEGSARATSTCRSAQTTGAGTLW